MSTPYSDLCINEENDGYDSNQKDLVPVTGLLIKVYSLTHVGKHSLFIGTGII